MRPNGSFWCGCLLPCCLGSLSGRKLILLTAAGKSSSAVAVLTPPMSEVQHHGSCQGRGLLYKAYHGYYTSDGHGLVTKTCPCCSLECPVCRMVARKVLWKVGKKNLKALVPEALDFPWVAPADCTVHSVPMHL